MLNIDHYMDIKDLHRQGHSIRQISRITGRSRNTVRKVLQANRAPVFKAPRRASKLDPYKEHIRARIHECNLSAVRLLKEIRSMGYDGGYTILKDFARTLRPNKSYSKLTVRFETPPGKQAQCDWGYCGQYKDLSGKKHSIYAFVYVLAHSRFMYVRFTTRMHLKTLLECHQHAFDYCGGWPEQILYDNMKQVRLNPKTWNPGFIDFIDHYGIIPKTHRPYRPRTKGKVERMVAYVKDSFLNGRHFADIEELNAQALIWLEHTANSRVHATTGQVPRELLAKEKLTDPGSCPAFRWVDKVPRVANSEAMVLYDKSHYSVPVIAAGQTVSVHAGSCSLRILMGDTVIAEHPRATQCGQRIENEEHTRQRWQSVLKEAAAGPSSGPQWVIGSTAQVQARELSIYEEVYQ